MNTIRTKICGITRPEDALAAAELGADAIGLVFYAKSKRAVNIEQARAVVRNLPPFVSVVALFVNENEQTIREILRQVPIDVIQFHGDEDDDFCRRFDRPYLKAVRVQSAADIQTACAKFPNARACCLMLIIRPNTAVRDKVSTGPCCTAISVNRGYLPAD